MRADAGLVGLWSGWHQTGYFSILPRLSEVSRLSYLNDDRITKSFAYELLTRNGVYSVFNTLDRDLHRAKRKVVGQAISQRSIRSFEPALVPQDDIFLKQIVDASSQPVNMTQKLGHLAVDVVANLALGYDPATQTSEENRFLPKSMALSFFVGNISHHFPCCSVSSTPRY
ncbi:hypothetical protein GGR54DRAFT_171540 [Hypoxylon sp. NC1633]|nr:hypothetical protein GGR54DRAFT_171540 [Hypoxylon sp. NC1633]